MHTFILDFTYSFVRWLFSLKVHESSLFHALNISQMSSIFSCVLFMCFSYKLKIPYSIRMTWCLSVGSIGAYEKIKDFSFVCFYSFIGWVFSLIVYVCIFIHSFILSLYKKSFCALLQTVCVKTPT